MAVYRYQITCVGMWRGKIKRWNTTFHMTSSTATSTLYGRMQQLGYPNPGDATGACSGGVASIKVYSAAGGAPLSTTTYFDWEVPSTWIPYTGTAWTAIPAGTPIDASGESALVIVGTMSGLSASGKPVTTRKFLHAIPSRTAADYADPDIASADVTSLSGILTNAMMANPAGVAPVSVAALNYYGNHQRVRGRRRTTQQVAQQSFSTGVVLGAGSAGGVAPLVS